MTAPGDVRFHDGNVTLSSECFGGQIAECVTTSRLDHRMPLTSVGSPEGDIWMIWWLVTFRAPCQLLWESLGFAHVVTRWSLSHQVLQATGTINKNDKSGESAPKAPPAKVNAPSVSHWSRSYVNPQAHRC